MPSLDMYENFLKGRRRSQAVGSPPQSPKSVAKLGTKLKGVHSS